jgi:hypothetical protein
MDSTVMGYDQQHKVGARTKKKNCCAGEDSHTCAREITPSSYKTLHAKNDYQLRLINLKGKEFVLVGRC